MLPPSQHAQLIVQTCCMQWIKGSWITHETSKSQVKLKHLYLLPDNTVWRLIEVGIAKGDGGKNLIDLECILCVSFHLYLLNAFS